ncbi:MAG: hypothetical protein FJ257_03180 [Phycisphaerae bacterium]|nr:hypothetical protein [Phycisphaerae bacterium]
MKSNHRWNDRFYHRYRRLLAWLARPVLYRPLMDPRVGEEYGITTRQKRDLLRQMGATQRHVVSATGLGEQLSLVARILSLPRSMAGDVIECGCFKGSSTIALSLACRLVGRRLVVCDSFEGLPPPTSDDVEHVSLAHGRFETYAAGEYAGALEEVKENLRRFGAIEACSFVKGYFENSLPGIEGRFAMAFLDVDLHESLKTCLLHLWPRLEFGAYLFTHEATQLAYVQRFFDEAWWRTHFGHGAPGLIGAGCGIQIGIDGGSGIGFTIKRRSDDELIQAGTLRHFCGDPTRTEA